VCHSTRSGFRDIRGYGAVVKRTAPYGPGCGGWPALSPDDGWMTTVLREDGTEEQYQRRDGSSEFEAGHSFVFRLDHNRQLFSSNLISLFCPRNLT